MNAETDAGKPWYSRDEATRLDAEAESILVKALKDLGPSDDRRAVRMKRQAEGELFVVRRLSAGKTAPEVVSRDLDGKEVRLSDYRGKVVVLDFWFTGCGPYRAIIPHEKELVLPQSKQELAFVRVSGNTLAEEQS